MKKKQIITIALIFAISALTPVVFAQSYMEEQSMTSAPPQTQAETETSISVIYPEQTASEPISREGLLGKSLMNYEGANLGQVVDVFADKDSDKIAYLIIRSGGVLGFGGSERAIPLTAVNIDSDGGLNLDMDNEKFKTAPTRPTNLSDRDWGRMVHEFYGVSPYWEESGTFQEPEIMPEGNLEME